MPQPKSLAGKQDKQKDTQSVLAKRVFLAGIIVFALSGWFWLSQVYSHPKNVFEGMLANSLKTNGVTRVIQQEGNGQTVDQKIHLQLGANNSAQAIAELNEKGPDTQTKIVTETYGSPRADYIRYNNIETTQRNALGEEFDFGEVIGEWGKSGTAGRGTSGELFAQSMLGIIPFGNLSGEDRRNLLELIRSEQVFGVDYANVEKKTLDGRPVYVYAVTVKPVAYITYLKEFARLSGLSQLQDTDPLDYASSAPLQLKLSVDAWSHQLVESVNNGRVESYKSYGVVYEAREPADSIRVEELQMKLRNIE